MKFKEKILLPICSSLAFTIIFIVLKSFTSQPVKPSGEFIKNHNFVSKSLVEAKKIKGIDLYYDVDSILFSYETNLPDKEFFSRLEKQLANQGWKQKNKSQSNPMGYINRKLAYGELRVKKMNKLVIVGYWESDTNQSQFAEKYLWKKMNNMILD